MMASRYYSSTGYRPVDSVGYSSAPALEAFADSDHGIMLYRTINYGDGEMTTAEIDLDAQDLLFYSVGGGVPAYGKVAGSALSLAANRATRVTFIPHGCDTSLTFGTTARSSSFLFPRHYLNARLACLGKRVTAPILYSDDETLRALLPMIEREIMTRESTRRLMIDGLALSIAVALARIDPGVFAREAARITLPSSRLRRLIEFIDANLVEPLSLDMLAQVACLSPFHLSRVFKQTTGVTLNRYITGRRIDRAREMLVQSRLPIEAVARACGFSGQKYFTQVFTRAVGVSPGRFRRTSQQ